MAKLYFKYGAMDSGKSTILLQTAHNYESLGYNVFLIKPKIDDKGEDTICSRLGISRKVNKLIDTNEEIKIPDIDNLGCILVDEVQFLSREQIDQLDSIVRELNVPVIAFGLRTDFLGKGFEGSSRLLEIADTIEEIKTLCKCGKKATKHLRKVNGEISTGGEQVLIDNKDNVEYLSVCGQCFYDNLKRRENDRNSN